MGRIIKKDKRKGILMEEFPRYKRPAYRNKLTDFRSYKPEKVQLASMYGECKNKDGD